MKRTLELAAALLLAACAATARADVPEVGEEAPAFVLHGAKGVTHSLAEHLGKRGVVLAWFPRAFTPG